MQFSRLSADMTYWRYAAYSVAGGNLLRSLPSYRASSTCPPHPDASSLIGIRTARDLALRFAIELGTVLPRAAGIVANKHTVTAAWAISLTYCAVDVGSDTYDVSQHGGGPRQLALMFAERSTFHVIASVALPLFAINQVGISCQCPDG